MRVGVIVAGGFSTRFGETDKALAELNDTPLLRHVANRLRPTIDHLIVNGREEQLDAFTTILDGYGRPLDFAPDKRPGEGPVAGIERGLQACPPETTHAAVIACDMPYVDGDLIERLFDRAVESEAQAVVPRTSDGWYQVLHAIYEPEAMRRACRRALDRDERKIMAPLSHLSVEVVDATTYPGLTRSVTNVNTREELENADRELAESG